MFNVRIARRGYINEYLLFVVFRAGCYGALLLQRAIIMTPFIYNAPQRALKWNIKSLTRIEQGTGWTPRWARGIRQSDPCTA